MREVVLRATSYTVYKTANSGIQHEVNRSKTRTVRGLGVLVRALRTRDLDECSKEIIGTLRELVASIENHSTNNGSLLASTDVHIRQIVGVDECVSASGSTRPRDTSLRRALEKRSEKRATTTVEQGGTDDDSVENGVVDGTLFLGRTPRNELWRASEGGAVGDDVVAVVAVHPRTGGVDVGEFGSMVGTRSFGFSGNSGEGGVGELLDIRCASDSVDHHIEVFDNVHPCVGVPDLTYDGDD